MAAPTHPYKIVALMLILDLIVTACIPNFYHSFTSTIAIGALDLVSFARPSSQCGRIMMFFIHSLLAVLTLLVSSWLGYFVYKEGQSLAWRPEILNNTAFGVLLMALALTLANIIVRCVFLKKFNLG